MDELLAGYEQEYRLSNLEEDFNNTLGASIAAEVNMVKEASKMQMEMAMRKEASLTHGDSIDNYMDVGQCERAMLKIDKSKS